MQKRCIIMQALFIFIKMQMTELLQIAVLFFGKCFTSYEHRYMIKRSIRKG